MEYEGDSNTIRCGSPWNDLQNLEKRGRIETIQITVLLKLARILKIILRRFVITQTHVKNHVRVDVKNLQGVKQY